MTTGSEVHMRQVTPLLLIGLLIWIIPGCAGHVGNNSSSDSREISIETPNASVVRKDITNAMLRRNYSLIESTDATLVFDGPMDKAMTAEVFGRGYENTPHLRVIYTLSESDGLVRVATDLKAVTHDGPELERLTDVSNHPQSQRFAELLNTIKIQSEPLPAPTLVAHRQSPGQDMTTIAVPSAPVQNPATVKRSEFLRR
jgi:hypothetical protein